MVDEMLERLAALEQQQRRTADQLRLWRGAAGAPFGRGAAIMPWARINGPTIGVMDQFIMWWGRWQWSIQSPSRSAMNSMIGSLSSSLTALPT